MKQTSSDLTKHLGRFLQIATSFAAIQVGRTLTLHAFPDRVKPRTTLPLICGELHAIHGAEFVVRTAATSICARSSFMCAIECRRTSFVDSTATLSSASSAIVRSRMC